MIAKMMMMVVVEVTWFPTCDIPSARKWLFKVEMADALEVQSFLIQRLVGLLLAESPVITGSQPGVRGCGPLSLLLIYSSFMIRDQSQQSENRGVEEGVGGWRTKPKGERENWLRVKWPFSCHYKQPGWQSTSWVSTSTYSTPAL